MFLGSGWAVPSAATLWNGARYMWTSLVGTCGYWGQLGTAQRAHEPERWRWQDMSPLRVRIQVLVVASTGSGTSRVNDSISPLDCHRPRQFSRQSQPDIGTECHYPGKPHEVVTYCPREAQDGKKPQQTLKAQKQISTPRSQHPKDKLIPPLHTSNLGSQCIHVVLESSHSHQ